MKGVRVGPLDPDASENFGQVAGGATARTLIRLHAQGYPGHLTRQLARPLDAERTKGLDLDEVKAHLADQTLENGDPLIPDGAVVEGVSVRGERDREQILSVVYRVKGKEGPGTGRTGKWFVPYDRDALPNSTERGDEAVRVHELRERGLVAFDDSAARGGSLERENAELRRRLRDLEKQQEAAASGAQARTAEQERAAAAESEPEPDPDAEGGEGEGEAQTVAQEPPVEGYEQMNADTVRKLLRDEGTSQETRQAILEYERKHADRSSVVRQAEQSLGLGDAS